MKIRTYFGLNKESSDYADIIWKNVRQKTLKASEDSFEDHIWRLTWGRIRDNTMRVRTPDVKPLISQQTDDLF